MKKHVRLLAFLLLLIGIMVFFFPCVSDYTFQMRAQNQYVEYKTKNCSNVEGYDDLLNQLILYNLNLYESKQIDLKDPWSYEQSGFDLAKYGFQDNNIGFITIAKLDLQIPIYLGASKENMDKGVALITQTSIPIGGNNTNAVLAAHRGMIKTKMFRDIDQLEQGDSIVIDSLCEKREYQVQKKKIINANAVSEILIQDNKDMITLISCHGPKDSQRIVVYCERKIN